MIVAQTATPSVREGFAQAMDLVPVIMIVLMFGIVLSIMLQMQTNSRSSSRSRRRSSKSQTKSKPLLKPLLKWTYDHTLGFVIDRKQYHYRTFGVGPFVRETTTNIRSCVHCDGAGDGFSISFGHEWVALGFVVWRSREGQVRVCETCEIEQRQAVAV